MTSTILVNSNQLRSKAEQLEQYNSQLKSALNALNTSEQTLAGMWEGDAQKAFRTAFQKDYAQFEAFYKGISDYITTLRTLAQNYDKAEDANVQLAK